MFDAKDLGQGKIYGGGEKARLNRFELFVRAAKHFDALDPTFLNNLKHHFEKIDTYRRAGGSASRSDAYGSAFKREMEDLIEDHKRGDKGALARWIRSWLTKAGALDKGLQVESPG